MSVLPGWARLVLDLGEGRHEEHDFVCSAERFDEIRRFLTAVKFDQPMVALDLQDGRHVIFDIRRVGSLEWQEEG